MVRAWYFDPSDDDRRLPHMGETPQFVSLEKLLKDTGVEYYKIDVSDVTGDNILARIRKERSYSYEDSIHCHEKMDNYEALLASFFEEHIHEDEEIRLITAGSGYFDVRDRDDRWLRLECVTGDMLILPAGIYHRFTLDTKNDINANRYFSGVPVWTPHPRPGADTHPARLQYVKSAPDT